MSRSLRTASSFADKKAAAPHEKNEYLYATSAHFAPKLPPGAKKGVEFTTHYCHPKQPLADRIREHSSVDSVIVIGAGVSGVVTARILLDEGVNVTVLEKTDMIAGVWAENYVGFGIQTPCALYHFPDDPLPSDWDFAAGGMIANYICQYAQKHGVTDAVQFNSEVTEVTAEPGGAGYVVKYTQDGKKKEQRCDLCVIAAGVYGKQEKFIPDWKGKDKFGGTLLHASDYLSLKPSEGKDVVTVGFGKSAFDCAQISAKIAKSSTLLFREAHWCVPRKVLNLIPFEFATFNRLGGALLQPMWQFPGPFERLLHLIPGLLDAVWLLVSKIFAAQFQLNEQTTPEKGFIEDFWCGHGVLPHPDFFPLLHSGQITGVKSTIKEIKKSSLVLANGKEIPCNVLIAATGYQPLRTYLPKEVLDAKEKDGLWLYRNMLLPGHPRLVFLNSETTTFTNITTASIQARWLAEALAGRHQLPSSSEQKTAVEENRAWKRKVMPNAGAARSYMIQTHQVHYYDQLLKDMGASVRRKRGGTAIGRAIREILDPYRPGDYDTIVTGEFKFIPGEQAEVGKPQSIFAAEGALFVAFLVLFYYAASIFLTGLRVTLFG
jgi:cation diffusion facilitator CzcD-associated flavoprotein CzcO